MASRYVCCFLNGRGNKITPALNLNAKLESQKENTEQNFQNIYAIEKMNGGRISNSVEVKHDFKKKTFHKPTFCHHCSDLLWGLTNQGVQCTGGYLDDGEWKIQVSFQLLQICQAFLVCSYSGCYVRCVVSFVMKEISCNGG